MKEFTITMLIATIGIIAEASPPPEESEFLKASPNRSCHEEKTTNKVDGKAHIGWGKGHGIEWETQLKGKSTNSSGDYSETEVTQKSDGSSTTETLEGHENLEEDEDEE
jgi:hypothetical protein